MKSREILISLLRYPLTVRRRSSGKDRMELGSEGRGKEGIKKMKRLRSPDLRGWL
jgi:hypothetical protein